MQGKRVLKKQRTQSNSSLLGTYFISLLSVMLCFVMLLGTTFALFYVDNTSVGNEIHSGVLKVDMRHLVSETEKISLKSEEEHAVFSDSFKWMPGNVQTQTVEVLNTGNVPLNFRLDFAPMEEQVDDATNLFTALAGQEDGVSTVIGSLDEVMDPEKTLCLAEGVGLQPGESRAIHITLRMDASASSGMMNKKILLFLKLEAFQYLDSEH